MGGAKFSGGFIIKVAIFWNEKMCVALNFFKIRFGAWGRKLASGNIYFCQFEIKKLCRDWQSFLVDIISLIAANFK